MDAASSIVLASRLHQIRSTRYSTIAGWTPSQYQLAPTIDPTEEGQRVNAFWTTFILDQNWSTAIGRTPVLADEERKGTVIDTPWPRSIETYEHVSGVFINLVRLLADDFCVIDPSARGSAQLPDRPVVVN